MFTVFVFQLFSSGSLNLLKESRIFSQRTEFDWLEKICLVFVNRIKIELFGQLTELFGQLTELFGQLNQRLTELFGQLNQRLTELFGQLTVRLTVQIEFLGSSNRLLPVRF